MGEREGKRRQPRKSVFHRLLLFVVGLGGCLGAGVHEGQDLREVARFVSEFPLHFPPFPVSVYCGRPVCERFPASSDVELSKLVVLSTLMASTPIVFLPEILFLDVSFLPHPIYCADGPDLHLDLPVAPWEAALGASLELPTPGGRIRVQVPAGARSGQKLRLKGRFFPEAPVQAKSSSCLNRSCEMSCLLCQ